MHVPVDSDRENCQHGRIKQSLDHEIYREVSYFEHNETRQRRVTYTQISNEIRRRISKTFQRISHYTYQQQEVSNNSRSADEI